MRKNHLCPILNCEPAPAPRRVSLAARWALGFGGPVRHFWGLLGIYWIAMEITMLGAAVWCSRGTLSPQNWMVLALIMCGTSLLPLGMILFNEIQRRRNVRLLKDGAIARAVP